MTDPAHDRDQRHKIDFLRRHSGRIVWMGVRHQDPDVHGHRLWILGQTDKTSSGTLYVWARRNEHEEWLRIAVDCIVRAAREEPAPEFRDYSREFDQGLSPKPSIDDVLAEASRHQLDGDAGAR
jgi:hypothetical protein